MTTDNVSPPEKKAIFDDLMQRLKRGQEDLKRGNSRPGQVKMWWAGVRYVLKELYGKEFVHI